MHPVSPELATQSVADLQVVVVVVVVLGLEMIFEVHAKKRMGSNE
jgi:hypothetical protein